MLPVIRWGLDMRTLTRGVALLSLSLTAGFLTGCVGDGASPDCPEMPITDDPFDPALDDWRSEAEAAGCLTPLGEDFESPAEPSR